MACKLLLLALLLSCASHTAHSAGVRDHPTSDAAPQEIEEYLDELIIEKITFTYRDTTTTIDVCLNGPTTDVPDYVSLTLNMNDVSMDHEGVINNNTCFQFEIERYIPADAEAKTYLLSAHFGPIDGRTTKTAIVSFAFTAESTLVDCGLKKLTRTSWGVGTTPKDDCLNDISVLPNVCYRKGDKSETDICFVLDNLLVTNSKIEVCRNEALSSISSNGVLSVNYLGYDQTNSPTSAEVSYSLDAESIAIEAAMWINTATNTEIFCNEIPCSLKDFFPSNTVYGICAVSTTPENSGYTTIQDVNLYAYDMVDPAIIEFGFLNSLDTSYHYTASLHTNTAGAFVSTGDSVNLDCTDVEPGHYCYGFLYYTTPKVLGDEAYLSLQYTSSNFDDPYNTIASKVLPASGTASGGRV